MPDWASPRASMGGVCMVNSDCVQSAVSIIAAFALVRNRHDSST